MTTKYSKVEYLPVYEGILTKGKINEIKDRFPGQPSSMDYRKEFIKGRGASTKDETWNKNKHKHTCCGSKVAWRHKANCETLVENKDEGNEKWKALGY